MAAQGTAGFVKDGIGSRGQEGCGPGVRSESLKIGDIADKFTGRCNTLKLTEVPEQSQRAHKEDIGISSLDKQSSPASRRGWISSRSDMIKRKEEYEQLRKRMLKEKNGITTLNLYLIR